MKCFIISLTIFAVMSGLQSAADDRKELEARELDFMVPREYDLHPRVDNLDRRGYVKGTPAEKHSNHGDKNNHGGKEKGQGPDKDKGNGKGKGDGKDEDCDDNK